MRKIKEVFNNIYDNINRKAESVARRILGVNSVQPEPVRVREGDLEQ